MKKERSGAGPLGSNTERRKGIRGETAAWSMGWALYVLTDSWKHGGTVAVEPLKATVAEKCRVQQRK